jgi:copper oxidase (laccase) domain-containing protein
MQLRIRVPIGYSVAEMGSKNFSIDNKTGLGSFSTLREKLGVANFVTYEGGIWGNMNARFARDKEEHSEIEAKERRLADLIGSKTIFVATTPQEGTLLNLDKVMGDYLYFVYEPDDVGYRFIPIRANGAILTAPQAGLLFAPADCPIFIFAQEGWDGVVCVHLGSPGVVQGLHNKALLYFQGLFPEVKISQFQIYITPHICPAHYSLKQEKYAAFKRICPAIGEFSSPLGGGRHSLDFVGLAKKDLEKHWGITSFNETGLCTYEEAKAGNLFSYTLRKEDENIPRGSFDVAVSLESER